MPVLVREFQPTPNPNALKCILDGVGTSTDAATEPVRSYRSAPAQGTPGDPVARALFAVPGVAGLLIASDWITVNKTPEASWSSIKPAVKAALGKLEHIRSAE